MGAASRQDIEGWLKRAQANGATHLLVGHDSFDGADYPVEVMDFDPRKELNRLHEQSGDSAHEVYDLMRGDLDKQLGERRAWFLPRSNFRVVNINTGKIIGDLATPLLISQGGGEAWLSDTVWRMRDDAYDAQHKPAEVTYTRVRITQVPDDSYPG